MGDSGCGGVFETRLSHIAFDFHDGSSLESKKDPYLSKRKKITNPTCVSPLRAPRTVLKALQAGVNEGGNIYNIGSGISYSLNEIIEAIEVEIGKNAIVSYESPREFDVNDNRLEISAAISHLLWVPKVNLSEGIKKYKFELMKLLSQ